MSDSKISELPVATQVLNTDNFVVSRSGSNVRIPAGVLFNTIPTFIGNSQSTEQVTTSGALDVTKSVTEVVTTNAQVNLTLGAGTPGQEKFIIFRNKGTQNVVITPAQRLGYNSLTLMATGSTIMLKYVNNAWAVVSAYNVTVI